ncbi:MAG: hypothetical protein J5769_00420 [Bacteroidales bacterium]|nr:hypothetical protein [Bacteroidales bacterium]
MKKLIFALSAALLLLSACGEKTATYTFHGAQITYPANWELNNKDDVFLYIQDPKVLSNSVDVEVYEMDEQSLAATSSEDLADFLKSMVYSCYEDTVTDDYEITFETDIQGTDSQAMMSLSGTAYGDPFVATISAWIDESIAFCTFVSAKDDKERAKIMSIFKYEVL